MNVSNYCKSSKVEAFPNLFINQAQSSCTGWILNLVVQELQISPWSLVFQKIICKNYSQSNPQEKNGYWILA